MCQVDVVSLTKKT